ncbi:MAG: AAA family ATPase [Thermoplasmata archaeon]|nr:AAA family ATPase [Thermoplasmata archaeon]
MPVDSGTPFIGRPELLHSLHARRAEARAGRGGVSLLEGDAGVGKSVLLAELLRAARTEGFRVIDARAAFSDDPPPFRVLRDAFRAAKLPLLPELEAPEPGSGSTSETRLMEALRRTTEEGNTAPQSAFVTLTDRLVELAREQPTLLAIENAGHADALSLDFVAFLAPSLERVPLWLLLTTPPLAEVAEPNRTSLERLARTGRLDRWVLRPLLPAEIPEFARWVIPGRDVLASEVSHWYSQTAGNPLFLEQLLQAQARGETPLWEEANRAHLPFREYLTRRLGELPEDERRVLHVASALGREFPFPLLGTVTGVEEERLAELVERLVGYGMLRETPGVGLEFARDDLRHAVYDSMPEPQRRLVHERIARALDAIGAEDTDTVFALARHAYLGRLDARAVEVNWRAAEIAVHSFAASIAVEHLDRALESLRRTHQPNPAVELELTLELAVQLDHVGELARAERLLIEARRTVSAAASGSSAEELLPIYLARILADEGRWDEARHLTDELLETVDTVRASARLELYRLRGEIDYYRGEYAESLRFHDLALEIARASGNEREVALEAVRRANTLAMLPDCLEESIPAYREAAARLHELGDTGESAFARLFLAIALDQLGRTTEALEELDRALPLAESAADPRRIAWVRFNRADMLREQGSLLAAREENERSRATLEQIGDRFGLAQTFIIAGKIELANGEMARAEAELLEAFRLVRELRTEADELEVLLRLAEVALGRGESVTARQRLDELTRREIGRLRPDLVRDVEKLSRRLTGEEHTDAIGVA